MTAHEVDLTLRRDLQRFGAFDIERCFNCGNCTAVCQHSDSSASLPRRLIRYGQLGLRERLLAAKEAWLCWNCRDCSDTCPRQARPSEYLEAVRRYTIASLDPTGVARLAYTSSVFLVGLALLLAALFAGVLVSGAGTPAPEALDLFGFLPFALIHHTGVVVLALVGLVVLLNVARFVAYLNQTAGPTAGLASPGAGGGWLGPLLAAAGAVVAEMANQARFRACAVGADRPLLLRPWFVHYCIMWGFIGLGVATAIDFLFKTPGELVPLWYPARLLGTVAGLCLLYGTAISIARYLFGTDRTRSRPLPPDWLFLGLLLIVGLTGFLLEVLVYLPTAGSLGYAVFLVHVALAMELLALLPFTKFAHAIYRPLAYGIYRFQLARSRPTAVADPEPSVAE